MRTVITAISLGLLAAGCGSMDNVESTPSAHARGQVSGTIAFRERIMLRPGTVVEVKLLQTSPADAPATELAKQVIADPPAPPIPFVLNYDTAAVDARLSYSVRATVKRGGRLLLTTDAHHPVLTRGAGNTVDLMLVAPAAHSAKPDAPLTNTYWKLVGIGSEPYQHGSRNREPHLQFGKQAGRVTGFTGCNNFSGSYAVTGDALALGEIAATRRACIEGMEVERRFLQALRQVDRYQISADTLKLLRGAAPALEFAAMYLR